MAVKQTFGQWYVFFGFQVKLRGEGIAAALTFDGPRIGFDVNDVAHLHFLLLQRFINAGVQF